MAEAETLSIAARIEENVEIINEGVQGVHHEVSLINTGNLFFSPLATKGRP